MNCKMVKTVTLGQMVREIAEYITSDPANQPAVVVVFGPDCLAKDTVFDMIVGEIGRYFTYSKNGIMPDWSAREIVSMGRNVLVKLSAYESSRPGERHNTVVGFYNKGAKSVICINIEVDPHDSQSQSVELRKQPPACDGSTFFFNVRA